MKKKLLIVIAIICTFGIAGFGYYQSTGATTDRLVTAIQHKDLKKVKEYLPNYSDDSKISQGAYQAYLATNPSKKQIKAMLKNECHLVDRGWFHQKYWEPQKRTLSLSGLDDVNYTKAALVINKKTIFLDEKGHQNFLPANYKLTVDLSNSAYGTVKKKEEVNLTQDNQSIVLSPQSDFEKSKHLHDVLLASFSAFLVSWNKSIPTMNFDNLKFVTTDEKEMLSTAYSEMKQIMSSYENEFNRVTINNSSVEIDTVESQPTVKFTAFVDRKQSIEIDKDKIKSDEDNKSDVDNKVTSDDGTVEVTMTYSKKDGHWKVDAADFDVAKEDPKDWDDKTSFTLPQEDRQAKWDKDQNQVSNI